MDSRHVLFDCNAWMEERRKIRKKCKEDGRGKSRKVRQLMGSRKVTPVVLGFIAARQVGQRVQRQKQEWRQRE